MVAMSRKVPNRTMVWLTLPKAVKFIFRRFLLISGVKLLKKVKIEQKCLKTAEKKVSTSFHVRTAPESWSKYTTLPYSLGSQGDIFQLRY